MGNAAGIVAAEQPARRKPAQFLERMHAQRGDIFLPITFGIGQ